MTANLKMHIHKLQLAKFVLGTSNMQQKSVALSMMQCSTSVAGAEERKWQAEVGLATTKETAVLLSE